MIDRSHVEALTARIPLIESELSAPGATANQKRYRELVREHAALKKLEAKATEYFRLQNQIAESRELTAGEDTDAELRDLARDELADMERRLPAVEGALMAALLPPDPTESRNAIVEIRAGTGGEEAALFASDLFRMYTRHAETRGWKIGVIDVSGSDAGGYKEIVFMVEGEGAYGELRYEGGGHRVQRVPVTESAGRIHTSAATVAVFPEAEPEDDVKLDPSELRIDTFCASGPGGQSVNTTYSAVRVTHLPTGLVAQSQDERSQQRNREKALAVLKARILDERRRAEEEALGNQRRSMIGSGDRSERIRTYNFPQNRLSDHRINLTLYSLDRIIEGDMGDLLAALRRHDTELRMEAQRKAAQPAAGVS